MLRRIGVLICPAGETSTFHGVSRRLNCGIRYDIAAFGTSLNSQDDERGLLASAEAITTFVAAEVKSGISSDRIIVGGFSQGGTLSLLIGLTTKYNLGGIVVLSGRLVLKPKIKDVSGLPLNVFGANSPDGLRI